jgi:adenosylcobinamide-phosphate guanylyltransferase
VIDALYDSLCFNEIIILTSKNSPKTKKFLQEQYGDKPNLTIIESSGDGYVRDLNHTLKRLDDFVFVVSGDMPLLDGSHIKQIISDCDLDKSWTSVLVTKHFIDSIGLNAEFDIPYNNVCCFFTGISLINSSKINSLDNIAQDYQIIDDKRIAFNLNNMNEYHTLQDMDL